MAILAALGGAADRAVELRDRAYSEETDTRKLILRNNLEEAKRIRNENRTKKETYKNLYGGLYSILESDDLVFDIMKRGTANAQAFLTNIQNFEQTTGINLAQIEQQKKLGMIPDNYVPPQNLPNIDDFIQNTLIGKAGQITPPRDVSGMEAAIKRHFGKTSPEVMSFQGLGQVAALTGQSIEDVSADLEGSRIKEVIRDGVTVSLPRDELTVIERATSLRAARNLEELQSQEHPVFSPDTGAVVTGKTQTWEQLQDFIRTYGQPRQIVAAYVKLEKQKGAPNALAKIWTDKLIPASNRVSSTVAMALNMDVTTVNGEQKFGLREGQENIVEELRAGASTFLINEMLNGSREIYRIDPRANIAYQNYFRDAISDTSVRSALIATAIAKDSASGLTAYTELLKSMGYSENSIQTGMGTGRDKSTGQVALEKTIMPSFNAYLGPKGNNASVRLEFSTKLEQVFDSQLKSEAIVGVGPDNMDVNKLFQNEDFGKALGLSSSIRNAVNNNLIDKEFVDKITAATKDKPLKVEDIEKIVDTPPESKKDPRKGVTPPRGDISEIRRRKGALAALRESERRREEQLAIKDLPASSNENETNFVSALTTSTELSTREVKAENKAQLNNILNILKRQQEDFPSGLVPRSEESKARAIAAMAKKQINEQFSDLKEEEVKTLVDYVLNVYDKVTVSKL